MKAPLRWLFVLAALLCGALAVAGSSSDVLLDALLQRGERAGTVVVPDRFLRSWDPITVFFAGPRGPADGGPEDTPERLVALQPDHPGAWTWLDGRTLQFRPAEPWPALEGVSVKVDGRWTDLSTLLPAPTAVTPRDGQVGLSPVETVTLTFPEVVPADALARMVTLELRPLPGIGSGPVQRLGRDDFEVKVLDRAKATDPARYTLVLNHPIPLGMRAELRLGLSLDHDADASVATVVFHTAEPFRATALGCPGHTMPVAPDGTRYPADQPLRCTGGRRSVVVEFSANPAEIGPIEGRNLVRFAPAVDDLDFRLQGRRLEVTGSFTQETLYEVTLAPTSLRDRDGRDLQLRGDSAVHLWFPRQSPYLRWRESQGIVERRGPKRVPVEGRGHGRVDVRVYRVEPLNRALWPFPTAPVAIDEGKRPPGPGEEPPPFDAVRQLNSTELTQRLQALGTPAISEVVDLPLQPEGGAARFGLDLEDQLRSVLGRDGSGHVLVGLRRLDGGTERSWVRLQVTDLSLTTIENPRDVRFYVTSLASGAPVSGATVRLEGAFRDPGDTPSRWDTLYEGTTDAAGALTWKVPGSRPKHQRSVLRIVVEKGADTLVLDPKHPPERFASGRWSSASGTWLQWAFEPLSGRDAPTEVLGHLFPERPIYRPGEPVHLKGYVRERSAGELSLPSFTAEQAFIFVQGPGGTDWRIPATITRGGNVYAKWEEDQPPTGTYTATIDDRKGHSLGRATFQVEAYELPTFELDLHATDDADQVPLDQPFDVTLTASYYAGGRVAARPVRWRVTQYPFRWTPRDLPEGFFYSSDGRYARTDRFEATPEIVRDATTNARGEAIIELDPTLEPTAQPRTYVVEATVTGADEQTVTATHRVNAVPPFVLGLKAPRYLERAGAIPVELLAAGPDGQLQAGREVTVRLLNRQWHSVLQASDFSDGQARYLTDIVDEPVDERTVTTTDEPLSLDLDIDHAGVWIVELESTDELGRAQVVRVDLYAGGDDAVAWSKPQQGTFSVSTDADRWRPGQTAKLVVRSPFQRGDALAIIEGPKRNTYRSVAVRGGKAVVEVPIEEGWVPRIPVHLVLRRGRTDRPSDRRGRRDSDLDVGKPQTLATTKWLTIEPVENRVEVDLTHPERALPGEIVDVTVKLADPDGNPLSGEVTLWMVDQAILALAPEARLDPLPDFITSRRSRLTMHDTRNLAFGRVPFQVMPGGDGGEEADDLLEKTPVRKDFEPVAFYDPAIDVGPSGTVTVPVKLPDNLTVFKVRAKATSGAERFGVGTSSLKVRLPVLVQPALPRFVRPGDSFEAAGIGRVVEGDGGPGRAQLSVEGLVAADTDRVLTLDAAEASRIPFAVEVPTPEVTDDGTLARDEVVVRMAIERNADGAADAFEVRLPLRDDRRERFERQILDLAPGKTIEIAPIPTEPRPNTVRRTVVLSDDPGLVRMASALDLLLRIPPRGTDQRLAKARVLLGLGDLRARLGMVEGQAQIDATVAEVLAWLPSTLDGRGQVANWPGGTGRISLTADALAFLADAREAGYPVDSRLEEGLVRVLKRGLRSDYRYFLDGESWYERTTALQGLAHAGQFDGSYWSELSRNARYLNPEATARVLLAGVRGGEGDSPTAATLSQRLSDEILTELYQGEERYAGLRSRRTDRNPLILSSEARALAHLVRAMGRTRDDDPKLRLAIDALIRTGGEDGWGQANADAAALLALAETLDDDGEGAATLAEGDHTATLTLGDGEPAVTHTSTHGGTTVLKHTDGEPLAALAVTRWVPGADGASVPAEQSGFVVTREWLQVPEEGPLVRTELQAPGETLELSTGEVLEEHVQVVVPQTRHYVVVTVPLAAGVEPLNPALATAPPEATPSKPDTRRPTWAKYYDDAVTYHFETLPKGTYDFRFRVRATVPGSFVQPPAAAEMLYDRSVYGGSNGARIVVEGGE